MQPTDFFNLLSNEALVHATPSKEGVLPVLLERGGGNLYFGTGVTTPKSPSIGLPFDILVFVLVAEKLRRALGMSTIIHHIADTHALTNPFCTPEQVARIAAEYREVMERIARVTQIPVQVVLSSEFDARPEYTSLLEGVHTDKAEYVKRELADMLWYATKHDVRLKLGWLAQVGESQQGFDERLYDGEFRRLFPQEELSFAYTVAGRTFDQKRPKASPYIAIAGERRVLLKPDERVADRIAEAKTQWSDPSLGGAIRHLNALVRLWERITGHQAGRGEVADRVQRIIEHIFS